jgi:anti-sigma factor ChrR (cupin superfamily)
MKYFFKRFKRRPKTAQVTEQASMQMLLHSVAKTEEQELSCDEVYALVDQFAEMVKRGEDGSRLMPMVQKHLNMCPDCREEYEALLKMILEPGEKQDWRF